MISAKEARYMANTYSVDAEELIKIVGDAIERASKRGEFKTDILLKPTMDPKPVDLLLNQLQDLGYDFHFTYHMDKDQPSARFILTDRELDNILHIKW